LIVSRWFITGTDTEVGKSVITACLAEAARDRGSVIAAKPIASGVNKGEPGEDATLLSLAAGHSPQIFAAYETPISPHRAARLEGAALDVPKLLEWLESLQADTVLIEGVGGWMVPLTCAPMPYAISDLARDFGAPVILVAANRLGVLNHTLLTVEAIKNSGLPIAGVVLNTIEPTNDLSQRSNLADLRTLLDIPVAEAPTLSGTDQATRKKLGAHLWQSLNLSC
jgi:dethiobiotin synthase